MSDTEHSNKHYSRRCSKIIELWTRKKHRELRFQDFVCLHIRQKAFSNIYGLQHLWKLVGSVFQVRSMRCSLLLVPKYSSWNSLYWRCGLRQPPVICGRWLTTHHVDHSQAHSQLQNLREIQTPKETGNEKRPSGGWTLLVPGHAGAKIKNQIIQISVRRWLADGAQYWKKTQTRLADFGWLSLEQKGRLGQTMESVYNCPFMKWEHLP